MKKIAKELDEFVDKVLRFKPKPRSKAAKKRVAQAVATKKAAEARIAAALNLKMKDLVNGLD